MKNGLWSSFWLDGLEESEISEDVDKNTSSSSKSNVIDVNIIRLSSAKRSIANFVTILTGENIPVYFWSGNKTGATDGKVVYISADIYKKSDFDASVGLALHEASHILLTDFELVQSVWGRISELYKLGKVVGLDKETVREFCKTVCNYVEDRYIDNYIFTTAPGYRPYYVALYDKYFNNSEIGKMLKSDTLRQPNLFSYEFRILNLTNSETDLQALPGLKTVAEILDLTHIDRLKKTSDRIQCAVDITREVFKNISESLKSKETEILEKMMSFDDFEKENDILGGNSVESDKIESSVNEYEKVPKTVLTKVKPILETQREFLNHHTRKISVSKEQERVLKIVEKSGISLVLVGSDVLPANDKATQIECVVVKKMTKELLESEMFPLSNSKALAPTDEYKNAIDKGITLGILLGKQLQLRQEENSVKFTRRTTGKIDRRLISELGFGAEAVFFNIKTDKFNKLNIHISVDASGSMAGEAWKKTIAMVVAICKASSMISNIRVCVSFRTTIENAGGYLPYIVLAYDSAVDSFSKIKSLFPWLIPSGGTPEGLTFEATMDNLIAHKPDEEYYFLTISDGMPCFSYKTKSGVDVGYSDKVAIDHTRKRFKEIINSGVDGLAYYIESSENKTAKSDFKKMYGEHSRFINVNNVIDIAKTINTLFLNKGKKMC
jgi:hypothetical protein